MFSTQAFRSRRGRLLAGGIGLVTAAALLTGGPAASAAPRHHVRSTPASQITFTISEPAGSQVAVQFSGGISNITNQVGEGDNLQVFEAANDGFAMVATHSDTNVGTDLILAQTTAGTPITGTANVPSGATLSVKVNGGAAVTIQNGKFSIPVGSSLAGSHRPS